MKGGRQRQFVSQRPGQAICNCQPQAETFMPVSFRVAQLVKLAEYVFLMFRSDAYSGIPYFDNCPIAAYSASHQKTAMSGVTNGIADQIS